eukprot:TRINITY_DN9345_c0_g2_i1.p1 TRINITY_DN9345_c0_g2~~TRINITY_DN9345_c0_g2_i1.p1  ORF type:complete len:1548 (+),score=300.22 TRINITY_DN9345_c0_g2_i1:52-4695(+)
MQPHVRSSVFCCAVALLVTVLDGSCVGGACQGGDEAQLMQRLVRQPGGASGKHRELLGKLTEATGVRVKSLDHAEELLLSLPKAGQINYDASKIVVAAMLKEAEDEQKVIVGQSSNMSKFGECEGKLALSHALTDASESSAKSEALLSNARKCQTYEKPCSITSMKPRVSFRLEAKDRGCKNWEAHSSQQANITSREECENACAKNAECKSYEWAAAATFHRNLCALYEREPCEVRAPHTSLQRENIGYNQYFKELICSEETDLVGGQCLTCQKEKAEAVRRKDYCVALVEAAVDATTTAQAADTREAAGHLAKNASICSRSKPLDNAWLENAAEKTKKLESVCHGVLAAAQEFARLSDRDVRVSLETLYKAAVDSSFEQEASRKKLRCETQLEALEESKQDCLKLVSAKKSEADALCKMWGKVLEHPPKMATFEGNSLSGGNEETAEDMTRRLKGEVAKAEEQLRLVSEGERSCEKAKEELAAIEATCNEKVELVKQRTLDCEEIVAATLKGSAGVQLPRPNNKPCAIYKEKKKACADYNQCYVVAQGINEYSFTMAKENSEATNRNYRQLVRVKCLLDFTGMDSTSSSAPSLDDCEKEAFNSDLLSLYPSQPPNQTACEENLQVCSTCEDMPRCGQRGWLKNHALDDSICPQAGCDDATCCQPTCVTMDSCSKPGFVKDFRMNERTCPEGGCDDDTCCKPTCASFTSCDAKGFIPDDAKSDRDCPPTGCNDNTCCMATCASMSKCQTAGFVKDPLKRNTTCIHGVGCDEDTCCKATCASMKECQAPGHVKDKTMDAVDCPAGGCDDATCCAATCSTMESCATPGFVVDRSFHDTECGPHGCDHATCCKPTCASIDVCTQLGFVRDWSKNSSLCPATGCDDDTCCEPTCQSMTSCKKPGFVKDERKDDTKCPAGRCDDDTCCEPTCESYEACYAVGWVKNTSLNSSLCRAGDKCNDATCCMPTCHSYTQCADPHFVKDFTKSYSVCPPGGCTDEVCCKPTCGSMASCVTPGFVKNATKDGLLCPPSGCNDDTCCMPTCLTMEFCTTYGYVKSPREEGKVCPESGCDDETCCKATCTSMSECTGRGHIRDVGMNSTDCPHEGCDDETCCTATCTTMTTCPRRGYVVADADAVCSRTGCTHDECCKPTCSSMSRCAGRGLVPDKAKDDLLCPQGRCDDSFCCKPTCETMQTCLKPGYAKNVSAIGLECPSRGCDDDICCLPTCASMNKSLSRGWVKNTKMDAEVCPDTGCDDATCSQPTCLSMEVCTETGYIKDPSMDSVVCGKSGCDDDTCCKRTCASMQVCTLGWIKKPSSDDTECGAQGCDDATCCQPTCASMQGCSSEDFYKLEEKDSEVCPATGCDDATCCKSMIQKVCEDDEFQNAAVVMNCNGANGSVHYKIEDKVVKLIADVPKTATNVQLSTATSSARYLDVKLVDPATGKCVVGYSGMGCKFSTPGDHEYGGMTIYYTGDTVQSQHVLIKGSATLPLQFFASPWGVLVQSPTGEAGYSYDVITDCPAKAPGCSSCSEYTGCSDGKTPVCDGTYKVKCM